MALYKVTKKQEGGGTTKDVAYLKWQILKTRSNPAGNILQMAEFYLYQNGEKYTWDSNVSISSNMAGNTGEDVSKLIDGNTDTKYCTSEWGSSADSECNIVISLGETITLDSKSSYSFVTGNDEDSRDPVSWKLYSSTDGTNWELLDDVNNAAITTNRQTETQRFYTMIIPQGNATAKRGSFVSASTQYGIVDVNVGFEPDLVLVEIPLGNNISTVSYWEKDLSYAQTDAIWCLKPAENVAYQVALNRQTGETGIQAINNDGFSFMSNGANTRGVTCSYVAVKYESTDIGYSIEQGQTITTDTQTASVTSGKYYLFNTVYGENSFTGADIIIGDTRSIYTTSGIGRCGCIVKAASNTITYGRYGNVSDNEYTELDVTNDSALASVDNSWSNGTSITTTKDKFYFLALADGETGDIVGADVLVEHKLEDTVSNGTRFLIVKSLGTTITLNNGNSFYYRKIGIVI